MKRISRTILFVLALLLSITPAATAAPPVQESYIVVLQDSVKSSAAASREIAGQVGGKLATSTSTR